MTTQVVFDFHVGDKHFVSDPGHPVYATVFFHHTSRNGWELLSVKFNNMDFMYIKVPAVLMTEIVYCIEEKLEAEYNPSEKAIVNDGFDEDYQCLKRSINW